MSRLGTTTWKERNYERLRIAKARAMEAGVYRPTIIDFGPGGAVAFLLDHIPKGDCAYHDGVARLRRGVFKLLETAMRKTGAFDLRTAEPEEVARVFEDMSPGMIYVVDKEPRVIDAVRRLDRSRINVPMICELADIEKGPLPYKGDVVVAYHSIERTGNPRAAIGNLASSVNDGGFLSTTFEEYVPKDLRKIEPGLYVKNASPPAYFF